MKIKHTLYLLSILALFLTLASCATVKGNVYPLDKEYIRAEELPGELNRVVALNPNLVNLRIIGFSSNEKIPLYALEIGEKKAAKTVLLIGQHHGDEVLGVNIAMAYARQLVMGYSNNTEYQKLLSQYRLWIVPSINPEGFKIVGSGKFQFKRKNNTDTDENKKLDLQTDGVDLNRNYPVFWDLDPDTNVSSQFYKGKEPMSESEIKAVVALAQQQNFELAVFLHSSASGAYSEKLYLPARGHDKPLYVKNRELAKRYAESVKKDYAKGTYTLHEGASSEVGNARNFFFHRMGCMAFLVEIGGINNYGQSVIHPDGMMLRKIVSKHVKALDMLFELLSGGENGNTQEKGDK